jgi:hypothetical protein
MAADPWSERDDAAAPAVGSSPMVGKDQRWQGRAALGPTPRYRGSQPPLRTLEIVPASAWTGAGGRKAKLV